MINNLPSSLSQLSKIIVVLAILCIIGISIWDERVAMILSIILFLFILISMYYVWAIVFLSTGLFIIFFIFEELSLKSGKLITTHVLSIYSLILFNSKYKLDWRELLTLPIILNVLLGLFLILGLSWTSDRSYGIIKSIRFFAYNIFFIIIAYFFGKNKEHIKQYLLFTSILSIILSIASIFYYSFRGIPEVNGGRVVLVEGMSYIWFGRTLGLALLTSIVYVYFKKGRGLFTYLLVLFIPGLLVGFILSGSRGPFFAAFICIVLFFFLVLDLKLGQKIFISIFLCVLLLGILYLTGKGTRLLQNPFELASDYSSWHRVEAWWASIQLFISHPLLGIGTGGFRTVGQQLFPWLLAFKYPHNLIMEVAGENGSIGLVLLLLYIGIIIKRGIKTISKRNEEDKALSSYLFILFIFTLLNSMVSGDITMNANMWLFSGFILGFAEGKSDEE